VYNIPHIRLCGTKTVFTNSKKGGIRRNAGEVYQEELLTLYRLKPVVSSNLTFSAIKNVIFYIYKTTNLLNNHFYIGKHVSYSINNTYLGSGKRLLNELKKYGKTNFKKEVLYILNNLEDLDKKEAEIITIDLLKDTNCINLILGGLGSWHYVNTKCLKGYKFWGDQEKVKKHREESSIRMKALNVTGKVPRGAFIGRKHTEETKNKMREAHLGKATWNKGKHHSTETREKISNSLKEYFKQNISE
jgi:hypothetical protein